MDRLGRAAVHAGSAGASRRVPGLATGWPHVGGSADGRRSGNPVPARVAGRVVERCWSDGHFVNSVTAMWRRVAMARRGVTHLGSHGAPHVGDDYNPWLLISLDWEVAALPETLARYRIA